jgi:multiple sugar transport system permease protein
MSPHATLPGHRRWTWPVTLALSLIGLFFAYPFVWMLLAVFKSNPEIFNPNQFLPHTWNVGPAVRLFAGEWFPFWRVLLNSLVIAFSQSLLATLVTALAGYAFATTRRSWVKGLFPVALVVIVLPVQALAVPLFSWANTLGLLNHLPGVILPGAVSGIGIIWFTQIFRHVPVSLRESARLDGAGEWRVWWTLLPTVMPPLVSYGLVHFILAWHDHLLPLLILGDQTQQTLPVAIASLYGSSLRYPYAALMAASVASILPTALLFGVCFRRFKTSLADVLMH